MTRSLDVCCNIFPMYVRRQFFFEVIGRLIGLEGQFAFCLVPVRCLRCVIAQNDGRVFFEVIRRFYASLTFFALVSVVYVQS